MPSSLSPDHWTCLRRLQHRESLGLLYLRGLVDDDARGPALTAAGRRALRAGSAS